MNSVERLALLEGHRCNRLEADYGYDLQMYTFDDGAFENGFVLFQLKATDEIRIVDRGNSVSFTVPRADLNLWYGEQPPVFLIVWDMQADRGYWLNIQEYLSASPDYPLPAGKATLTVRLPTTNVMDGAAIRHFRDYKNSRL